MAQKANTQGGGMNLLSFSRVKNPFFMYILKVVRFIFTLRAVNTCGRESTKAWNGCLVRRA